MIYDRIIQVPVGEVVEYEELSILVGRKVQQSWGYSLMMTARRKALRDDRAVFSPVTNVGLKRLSNVEIAYTGPHYMKRLRNTSSRGLKVIACVNYESLPQDAKIQHNMYASAFGALSHFSKASSIKRIEAKVTEAHSTLPLQKTIDAFRG